MTLKKELLILALLCPLSSMAGNALKDTTEVKQENSAIFLNAASDGRPREVSLGLPTNNSNCVPIFEDGLPVSYYIYQMYPYKSWHGGASAATTGTMGPTETAMRYGEINNYVDSYNKVGSEVLGGSVNFNLTHHLQTKLDINLSGPIAKGWAYSLSAFVNLDPGSNKTVYPALKDRHQFYKAAVSKSLDGGRGSMSLVYQYVDYMSINEAFGPFVFNGDGSVSAYGDFNLGLDSYRPSYPYVGYMDFMTGEYKESKLEDSNRDRTHHLTFKLDYAFDNGGKFVFRSRLKHGKSIRGAGSLAGIDDVNEASGYTREDGSVYVGKVQKRQLIRFDAFESSWMNNAEYSMTAGNHQLRLGADYHLNHGGTINSSSIFAHEVCANPQMLLFKGDRFYNFNTGGEYYDGVENKLAVYAKDNWSWNDKLFVGGFIRLEGLFMNGKAANNIGDDKSNTRYSGFNLTKGKITTFNPSFLNGAAGLEASYKLFDGFMLLADATFTRSHGNIFNYGGFTYPENKPIDTFFARLGFSYQNKWFNVLSQLTYITQSNYTTRTVFQHTLIKESGGYPAGYTESITLPLTYGISSIGWVTDANFTPVRGLNIHLSLTLRDPRYRNFIFSPTFSDGVTETYDFSGNNVTNLHKFELVLDPSYSIGKWRVWTSIRYISRQYISKTNALFFKGRVETFGGVDFRVTEKVKLSLNVINFLNQKGASGNISSADLATDPTAYQGYLMSGTFIRPFTVDFGVAVNF